MKNLKELFVSSVFQYLIAVVIGLVLGRAWASFQDPVTALDQPASENGFVLIVDRIDCHDHPEDPHRTCNIKWLVENRSGTARPLSGSFILFVGDQRYPATVGNGFAFRSAIFPYSQAEATTVFEIPVGAAPTRVAIDTDEDGRSAVIDVYVRAGP